MAAMTRSTASLHSLGCGTAGGARHGGRQARATDLVAARPHVDASPREDEMAAADGAPPQGVGLESGPSVPVSGLRWRRAFRGDERQLRTWRRWLASLLPDCAARDGATCIATELGTNAVKHTVSGQGDCFAAEITWYPQVVRIAVEVGSAAEGPQTMDDPAGDHGCGLLLVRGLSVRMGVCGDRRGRMVWVEVSWDGVVAAGSASPKARYEVATHDEVVLARRFAGAAAWFGRSSQAWWAVAGGAGLLSAPSAGALDALLYRLLCTPDRAQPSADWQGKYGLGKETASHHQCDPDTGSRKVTRWRCYAPASVSVVDQARLRDPADMRRGAVIPAPKARWATPQACA
jgi:hypothetical protein